MKVAHRLSSTTQPRLCTSVRTGLTPGSKAQHAKPQLPRASRGMTRTTAAAASGAVLSLAPALACASFAEEEASRAFSKGPGKDHKPVKTLKTYSCSPVAAQETAAPPSVQWVQKTISLPNHSRGCHVVTRHILKDLPEIAGFEIGMANFFIQHTSCSLTINENASSDVPLDLNDYLDKVAPEGNHYRHLDEGYDDMPAHLKSSLMGVSLTIPIQRGRLALGTWQGIYLNEHRDYGGTRKIMVTLQGQARSDGRKYGSSIF